MVKFFGRKQIPVDILKSQQFFYLSIFVKQQQKKIDIRLV
jgi:hypothetical protein